MASSTTTTKTVITIDGTTTPVTFTDLNLDERVLETNQFSFAWTPDGNDGSLSSIVQFKDANLSKAVTISFNDSNGSQNHVFKGIITQINSRPGSDLHVNFHISGNGIFCKINGKVECNSFYKKTLMDIVNAVGSVEGATLLVNAPKDSSEQQYIVQYNQTSFDFIKMLAIRYGEWMYYTGDTLVFGGKPSGTATTLKSGQDITNINIHAHAAKANDSAFGFDVFKGEAITGNTATDAPGSSALLATSGKAGNNVFTTNGTGTYYPGAATKEMLDAHNKLQQQAATASTVFVSATSKISTLTVGSFISITDKQDSSGKQFIIVEIRHAANNNQGYSNHFTAVPAEVETPHYTNPWLFARATSQAAIVKDNVDKDGLDRIKVNFPWMKKEDTTPWIQVLTPYAGSNKGIRWLPEKEEEVIIDFLENNVERPVMVGSFHTDKHKSGVATGGNSVKQFMSNNGRGMLVDDGAGVLMLTDHSTKAPLNAVRLKLGKDDQSIFIESKSGDTDFSVVKLQGSKQLGLGMVQGGELILDILFDADSKKITIKSEGTIEINADESISMNAPTINLTATKAINLDAGDLGAIQSKGLEFDVNVRNAVGLQGNTVFGQGKEGASLQADGPVTVKGSIVMIN